MSRSRTIALLAPAVLIVVAAWFLLGHPPTLADAPLVVVPGPTAASNEIASSALILAALDAAPLATSTEATTRMPVAATVETFTLQRPLDVKIVGGKEVLAADRCADVDRLLGSIRFDRVDVIRARLQLDEESILAILDRVGRFVDERHGPYSMSVRKGRTVSSVTKRVGTRTYTFTSAEFPEYAEVASAVLAQRDKGVDVWGETTQRVIARAEEVLHDCPKQVTEAK